MKRYIQHIVILILVCLFCNEANQAEFFFLASPSSYKQSAYNLRQAPTEREQAICSFFHHCEKTPLLTDMGGIGAPGIPDNKGIQLPDKVVEWHFCTLNFQQKIYPIDTTTILQHTSWHYFVVGLREIIV